MENTRLSIPTLFFAPIQNDIQEVEQLIRAQATGYHPDLQAALDHLLLSGGKRIRPTVTLLIGKMLGAAPQPLLNLAAAIELLHTATLVHDDLIDGSLLRRGNSTLNAKWSPGATVLTGDFLFSRAAMLAAGSTSIPVMELFASTLSEIVNGELAQLFNASCQIDREEYNRRIYAKTASLFQTSAAAPALLSDAPAEIVDAFRQYGYEIGMAFQIMDDILDFTGQQEVLGKPVASDLRHEIITLPTICYVEQNPQAAEVIALRSGDCSTSTQNLDALIEAIRTSGAITQAAAEAQDHVRRAVEALDRLPDYPEKPHLEHLARYIVDREL